MKDYDKEDVNMESLGDGKGNNEVNGFQKQINVESGYGEEEVNNGNCNANKSGENIQENICMNQGVKIAKMFSKNSNDTWGGPNIILILLGKNIWAKRSPTLFL